MPGHLNYSLIYTISVLSSIMVLIYITFCGIADGSIQMQLAIISYWKQTVLTVYDAEATT